MRCGDNSTTAKTVFYKQHRCRQEGRSYCIRRTVAAKPSRRKFRVWNRQGHMTTLPVAVPDVEILAVRFLLCVMAERYIRQQL